ncbi:hypothetical protein GCM10011609_28960 [Lentzea pudingi]|uniref:XRE family transcriptional regulator n=1 Tax=Lentzea pudingi TaxID=1789439 RepID=A0ABQ2HV36_9PSEU|nr:XRE family transcriptional regulator [Lentzea pudingi]GGM90248.1 hypothetical protein GCM10011609_28960 [Lentzea pudingi]
MTDSFAEAFRCARLRTGLSLERVHAKLADQGFSVSIATLSTWQRGRSQPEQPASLQAIPALERILAVAPGTLSSRLRSTRPRGRVGGAGGREPVSPLERALGDEYERYRSHVRLVSVKDLIRVGADRASTSVETTMVVRATRDDLQSVHHVVTADDVTRPPRVTIHTGHLGEVRTVPAAGCVVVEMRFGCTLARNETAIVHYEQEFDGSQASKPECTRRFVHPLNEWLLHVVFHPSARPEWCRSFFRADDDGAEQRVRRVGLDSFGSAHLLVSRVDPGIHGLAWDWPV